MKKNQLLFNTFFVLVFAVFLNKASFAEPLNVSQLKKEVQIYHDSGVYQQELAAVIDRAHQFLIERTKQNQSKSEKLAIVLDIDETSLSNYDHIIARDFAGDKKQIHQEILAANAPALKPMLSFYNDSLQRKVAVFFVTGRKDYEQKATIQNLNAAGYHDWAGIYLKPATYNEKSIIPFKSNARAAIAKQGYTIIASIGDQESDLIGGYAEKTFKLPNPYYYLP